MLKHHKIDYIAVDYPVGNNMANVTEILSSYSTAFRKLLVEEKIDITQFNLWCRGSSGAILSGMFVMSLPQFQFSICHIKKDGENSHSENKQPFTDGMNIAIDDFISGGDTIRAIMDSMWNYDNYPTKTYYTKDILIVVTGANRYNDIKDAFQYIISSD